MLMFAAASMGGAALQKGLGAIHSISHPVGARYDTHHGMTNAVLFPYVALANRPAIEEKMHTLAGSLKLPGSGFDAVLAWRLGFREELGASHTLSEIGVKPEDVAAIAADACRDPTALYNPRRFDASQYESIVRAAIDGDLRLSL